MKLKPRIGTFIRVRVREGWTRDLKCGRTGVVLCLALVGVACGGGDAPFNPPTTPHGDDLVGWVFVGCLEAPVDEIALSTVWGHRCLWTRDEGASTRYRREAFEPPWNHRESGPDGWITSDELLDEGTLYEGSRVVARIELIFSPSGAIHYRNVTFTGEPDRHELEVGSPGTELEFAL